MPGVVTIHQQSETSTKPDYFRGHTWGFLALVLEQAGRRFAVPLRGELHLEARNAAQGHNGATRIVHQAIEIARRLNRKAYLGLDAAFGTQGVFRLAAAHRCRADEPTPWVHIITRAKKNAVGYQDPEPSPAGKRGKKRKYGKKLKLTRLFEDRASEFVETICSVYGRTETVQTLCLDLLWKPVRWKIRFVLAVTSRGAIVLMSSDLTLAPEKIVELYCRRVAIETMFLILGSSQEFVGPDAPVPSGRKNQGRRGYRSPARHPPAGGPRNLNSVRADHVRPRTIALTRRCLPAPRTFTHRLLRRT
jgi:hypothetical protein